MCEHEANTDVRYSYNKDEKEIYFGHNYYICNKCSCYMPILEQCLAWEIPFDGCIEGLSNPTTNTFSHINKNSFMTILQVNNNFNVDDITNEIVRDYVLNNIIMKVSIIKKILLEDERIDNPFDEYDKSTFYEVIFSFDSLYYCNITSN